MIINRVMTVTSSISFQGCQACGRKLNVASAPAATETEMVNT